MSAEAFKNGWKVAAASLRGRSHEKNGQPCQDALCWQQGPGASLLAAVADGAGSARYGDLGARTAARAAVELLAISLPAEPALLEPEAIKLLLLRAVLAARKSVLIESEAKAIPTRELATTLLVLLATPGWVAASQVGDGATVVGDGNGNWVSLTRPPDSEYLNETVFLTSETVEEQTQISLHGTGARHLSMISDGLQMLALKMPEARPHAPFFDPVFAWLQRANDPAAMESDMMTFLRSPRIATRTDDDLTLLVASADART